MHLTRCREQQPQTLEEFYQDLASSDTAAVRLWGGTILSLLARLKALPDGRRVYGLTSHCRLCLLAEDSYLAPWFVTVEPRVKPVPFSIEYLMPERLGPWPNARVRGEAHSEDEAVQMILTAMEKSEGWSQGG